MSKIFHAIQVFSLSFGWILTGGGTMGKITKAFAAVVTGIGIFLGIFSTVLVIFGIW
jgi:hypothetical protein